MTATPDQVAADIIKAQQKKVNVVYTMWIWKYLMVIMRNIPEFQFKKMSI